MNFEELPMQVQISVNAVGGPRSDLGKEMMDLLVKREGVVTVAGSPAPQGDAARAVTLSKQPMPVMIALPSPAEEEDPVLAILSAAAKDL